MAKTHTLVAARKQIVAAINTNAEAAITAPPGDVESFANAVQTLTSALVNLTLTGVEDAT